MCPVLADHREILTGLVGIGVLASTASGIAYGAANLVGGLAARRQPVILALARSQSVALVIVTAAATLRPGHPTAADIAVGAVAGLAAGIGVYLAYRCFRAADIGVSAVLLGVAQLAVPATAGLLGGAGAAADRPVSPILAAGLATAVAAIAVLAAPRRRRSATSARTVVLALGAGAAFGGYHATMATSSPGAGLWPLVAAEAVMVIGGWTLAGCGRATGAAQFAFTPITISRDVSIAPPSTTPAGTTTALSPEVLTSPRRPDRTAVRYAAGDGVLSAAATLAGLAGVRSAALPTAGALLALLPTVTTLVLARFVLRQRRTGHAALGLGLAAVAVVLLAGT